MPCDVVISVRPTPPCCCWCKFAKRSCADIDFGSVGGGTFFVVPVPLASSPRSSDDLDPPKLASPSSDFLEPRWSPWDDASDDCDELSSEPLRPNFPSRYRFISVAVAAVAVAVVVMVMKREGCEPNIGREKKKQGRQAVSYSTQHSAAGLSKCKPSETGKFSLPTESTYLIETYFISTKKEMGLDEEKSFICPFPIYQFI